MYTQPHHRTQPPAHQPRVPAQQAAQPQAPRRPRRQPPSWALTGGLLVFGLMFVVMVAGGIMVLYLATSSDEPALAQGVTIAGLAVGDQSYGAAANTLAAYNFSARPVLLTDQSRQWSLTLGELGVGINQAATLDRAKDAAPGVDVAPAYTIDLTQTQTALIALSDQVNIDAVPGDPPQIGRAVDIPAVLNRLYTNLEGELADGELELTMIVTEPPPYDPVQHYAGAKTTHIVEAGQELALIARQYGVDMADIVALNELANPDLLYVGQELIIPAASEYTPSAADSPPAPLASGKSIVVSTDAQRIYAYENGQLVRSHLVSTGLPATPTVKGDYKVYVKYVADDMSGDDYYLPQVPYTMYFYQGYGIHGTYWHNSFGRPMSHGCVNLPTDEAKWFFEWAEVGTLVRVI